MKAFLTLAGTAIMLATGTALSAQSAPSGTPTATGQPAAQEPQATPANETPPSDAATSTAPSDPGASSTATEGTPDQKADKKTKKKQPEDQPPQQ